MKKGQKMTKPAKQAMVRKQMDKAAEKLMFGQQRSGGNIIINK